MDCIRIANVRVSRFILGSNPFSGFSHQGSDMDLVMKRHYTTARIKQTIAAAEALGVNALIARTDYHVIRVLLEHWDEGGAIQWFAQTCPGVGDHAMCVNRAADGGAKACAIHGGVMDYLLAQGKTEEVPAVIEMIRQKGMLAGIAGHNPKVFVWAEEHLDVDYYMCCYYNAAHRDKRPEHVSGMKEWFLEEDRQIMTKLIQGLSRPVIHYKIMAAGRNQPAEAFACAAKAMRPTDAVCVGVFTRDVPDMLEQDIELLEKSLPTLAPTKPE